MPADRDMLLIFQRLGVPHQLVATKADRLSTKGSQTEYEEAMKVIKDQASFEKSALLLDEIIAVGSLQGNAGVGGAFRGFGVRNLQWAILKAVNLEEYAMGKAMEHKKIPRSAVQRVFARINPDITNLLKGQASTQSQGSSESEESAKPSSPSLPSLNIQDFMREILGTSHAVESDTTTMSEQASDPNRLRDLGDLLAGHGGIQSSADLDKQMESSFAQLQSHMHPRAQDQDTSTQPRDAATPPSTPLTNPARKPTSHGADAFETLFAEPPQPQPTTPEATTPEGTTPEAQSDPQPLSFPLTGVVPGKLIWKVLRTFPVFRKSPANAVSGKDVSRSHDAPEQSKEAQREPSSNMAEKRVSRGVDEVEAMFAERPKIQPKQVQSSEATGQQETGVAMARSKSIPSSSPPQPAQTPALTAGKGVMRGIDAFESMFAEPAKAQKAKKRRH